ncbi:MAG TPA: 16S rRNA (cytosine(1402)-N(4))-methyltransferase RsmH [Anaerolineales bacterium]|nr:16S rRNA (cytosine(1402)-N(4))-methyltransferase RsmH [Anaerolineales bacterium]
MKKIYSHEPVLYQEIIHALNPSSGGRYVDGTIGAGGHASGILMACEPDGELLGMDIDPQAVSLARQNLQKFGARVRIIPASYTTLSSHLAEIGWEKINGMVLDLGASSMQFDDPDRGFSFQVDSDLDMRFEPSNFINANKVVNDLSETELADLLFKYGEEPKSRQIARAIIQARPITGTVQLARVISSVYSSRGKIHPATRSFQAIRIAVNDELKAIETVLPQAINALAPGGRLAVISFHSLEDRIAKSYFRQESRDCICPPKQPVCTCGHKASVREINRRPIMASEEEIQRNPRARSAKLRIVEKLDKKNENH